MTRRKPAQGEKPLLWVGPSKRSILEFPHEVQDSMGFALSVAQFGGKYSSVKPWKGEGPGMFEIVEDHRGDTYRAIYTVRFARAIYVLHAFQKKSPKGSKTARTDVELIGARLQAAEADYEVRYGKDKN